MKQFRCLMAVILIMSLFASCGSSQTTESNEQGSKILATTYPMYYLTSHLTEGIENITVDVMVSEAVSCLHDYTLTTEQMKKIERADLIVMNGMGLEEFMTSALESVPEEKIFTAAISEDHVLRTDTGELDPHYWLNPDRYLEALQSVAEKLVEQYPVQEQLIIENEAKLEEKLKELSGSLKALEVSCQEMITFHDGFSYFADGCGLTILAAIEEEEGAEASAAELKEICNLIEQYQIPAIFVEKNGSTNAAEIIARETGVQVYTLNMIMDGQTDYITAMEENIRTVEEALS